MQLGDAAQRRLAQDAYVRAALPALVHRANNATQILTGLNALLTLPGGTELFEARRSDLDAVSRLYEQSGWLLAVFGSALGAATLNDRRERDGLDPVLELARELFRRRGRDLEVAGAVPRLSSDTGRGWEIPWSVGAWLHGALLAAPEGAVVRASFSRAPAEVVLEDDAPFTLERAALAHELEARSFGLRVLEGRARLAIARAWFEPARTP